VRLQTELKLMVERQQQQLLQREAAVYNQTNKEISAVVARYAQAHGIRLVLRSSDNFARRQRE